MMAWPIPHERDCRRFRRGGLGCIYRKYTIFFLETIFSSCNRDRNQEGHWASELAVKLCEWWKFVILVSWCQPTRPVSASTHGALHPLHSPQPVRGYVRRPDTPIRTPSMPSVPQSPALGPDVAVQQLRLSWHPFCLSPPLDNVPDGDWPCPDCDSVEMIM
jgi:hypothetical protein